MFNNARDIFGRVKNTPPVFWNNPRALTEAIVMYEKEGRTILSEVTAQTEDNEATRSLDLALTRSSIIHKSDETAFIDAYELGVKTYATYRRMGYDPGIAFEGVLVGLLYDISQNGSNDTLERLVNHYGPRVVQVLKNLIDFRGGCSVGIHARNTIELLGNDPLKAITVPDQQIMTWGAIWTHTTLKLKNTEQRTPLERQDLELLLDLTAAQIDDTRSGAASLIDVPTFLKLDPRGQKYRTDTYTPLVSRYIRKPFF